MKNCWLDSDKQNDEDIKQGIEKFLSKEPNVNLSDKDKQSLRESMFKFGKEEGWKAKRKEQFRLVQLMPNGEERVEWVNGMKSLLERLEVLDKQFEQGSKYMYMTYCQDANDFAECSSEQGRKEYREYYKEEVVIAIIKPDGSFLCPTSAGGDIDFKEERKKYGVKRWYE